MIIIFIFFGKICLKSTEIFIEIHLHLHPLRRQLHILNNNKETKDVYLMIGNSKSKNNALDKYLNIDVLVLICQSSFVVLICSIGGNQKIKNISHII